MISIQGVYDGQKIMPLEKIDAKPNVKVIITFLEENVSSDNTMLSARQDISNLRRLSSEGGGRSKGWHFKREEIYDRF
ncbi:MAG: hypothetical protein BWK80_40085 [Desulfobacteraceae bacterium IS3]|nr:MAG: hypothetical protein BWK80_40085 [Desulfobacteraceae bacterium IS3]